MVIVFIPVGSGSGVVRPEGAKIHVGVALDNPARQGGDAACGWLLPGGTPANAIVVVVALRGRVEAGVPKIHLEVVVLDLEASEEDERDDRRHDAATARRRRRVLHLAGDLPCKRLQGRAPL